MFFTLTFILKVENLNVQYFSCLYMTISQMITDNVQVTIAIKYEVIYELSIGIFTFDHSSFYRSRLRSCTFCLQIYLHQNSDTIRSTGYKNSALLLYFSYFVSFKVLYFVKFKNLNQIHWTLFIGSSPDLLPKNVENLFCDLLIRCINTIHVIRALSDPIALL